MSCCFCSKRWDSPAAECITTGRRHLHHLLRWSIIITIAFPVTTWWNVTTTAASITTARITTTEATGTSTPSAEGVMCAVTWRTGIITYITVGSERDVW
jgi:hypothetical protein